MTGTTLTINLKSTYKLKIDFVPIFADPNEKPLRGFYAVRYEDMPENENSWSQFMDKLSDPEFRREFMKARKETLLTDGYWGNISVADASQRALDEFTDITDALDDEYNIGIEELLDMLYERFQPLDNKVADGELLETKGKPENPKEPWIRLYAIKVSDELYLFTGGAIKLVKYMEDDEATRKEKRNLEKLRIELVEAGMYEQVAFTELEL